MKTQFVRIFPGSENARMNIMNWTEHCELMNAEESHGEGWYPVQKGQKPQLGPGQLLGWRYVVENGVALKEYFVWNDNRDISKRKLMNNLKAANLWTIVKGFMEQNDIWDDFAMATTLEDDDQLIRDAVDRLANAGVATRETLEGIISNSKV